MSEFSRYLTQLRKESGFKTAHEFWSKNGGRKVLGFSYVNYWKIEKGDLLPRPERINILAVCLRLGLGGETVRRLVLSYLKELLGSGTVYEWMIGLISGSSPGKPDAAEKSLVRRVLQSRYYSLKPGQEDAIYSSYASYWIWATLAGSAEPVHPSDLSKMTGVAPGEILRAAKKLNKAGLVRVSSKGIHCPFARKSILMAPTDFNLARRAKLREYHAEMIKRKGELAHRRYIILRADQVNLSNAYASLNQALGDLSAYTVHEKTTTSALFLAETNILRLFKF